MKTIFNGKASIVMAFLIIGYIFITVYIFKRRASITHWGSLTLLLFFYGLLMCIFAATRDNYHLSVQYLIDGSAGPGLFTVFGIPGIIGMVIAAIILIIGILTLFLHRQPLREALCLAMCGAISFKIIILEIMRLFALWGKI